MRERDGLAVTREVAEQAMKQCSERALNDEGLQPALTPLVEMTSSAEGGELEFSLTVDIRPNSSGLIGTSPRAS